MTTKQLLPVVAVLWGGLALWTLRSGKAHTRIVVPQTDDEADEEDGEDDEDDDRGLSSVWSNGDEAFAVGERGAVYHSADGGRVWVRQETGVDEDLHAVWGDKSGVFAVGDDGRILRQTAPGVWQAEPSGSDEDLHAVWGSGSDIWAAGDGGVVLSSHDGGRSWRQVESGTDEDLRAIAGAPGGVYVSGDNGVLKKLSATHAVSTTGGAPAPRG
jgi:photosystem II stability/assembly factor-like uncharacterized protein